jgi:hypothetical protein
MPLFQIVLVLVLVIEGGGIEHDYENERIGPTAPQGRSPRG